LTLEVERNNYAEKPLIMQKFKAYYGEWTVTICRQQQFKAFFGEIQLDPSAYKIVAMDEVKIEVLFFRKKVLSFKLSTIFGNFRWTFSHPYEDDYANYDVNVRVNNFIRRYFEKYINLFLDFGSFDCSCIFNSFECSSNFNSFECSCNFNSFACSCNFNSIAFKAGHKSFDEDVRDWIFGGCDYQDKRFKDN
jgi:hypothetical protein